jgi:hypothetical protein
MLLSVILAAALAVAPPDAQPRPVGRGCYGCGKFGATYINTAGHVVKRPMLSDEKPEGATGRCSDGYWTFSEGLSGACQGHKGVAVWLKK